MKDAKDCPSSVGALPGEDAKRWMLTPAEIAQRRIDCPGQYTTERHFAQLLNVKVPRIRWLVKQGRLPVPCLSMRDNDLWHCDTVVRIAREVRAGILWIGR